MNRERSDASTMVDPRGPERAGRTGYAMRRLSGTGYRGLRSPRLVEDAGIYCLVLRLRRPHWVAAGKLERCRLAAGWYAYVGSAKRNLTARLTRHLRYEKRLHWHIDYLRAVARVDQIWIWPWTEGGECRTNGRIQALSGARVPWRGFGSSDCGCAAHLTVFDDNPTVRDGDRPVRLFTDRQRTRPPGAGI